MLSHYYFFRSQHTVERAKWKHDLRRKSQHNNVTECKFCSGRGLTPPRGLAIATSSLFASSIIFHTITPAWCSVRLRNRDRVEKKNASPSQDVIRIMKRLARSCCCDVLMKLVFDLKISQEAQTHPAPMLGIQALCCVPPCLHCSGGRGEWRNPVAISGECTRGDREKAADNQKSIFSWTLGAFSPPRTLANEELPVLTFLSSLPPKT